MAAVRNRRDTLFYGDNLQVLRDHIPDESIDLIYLDPPFNSSRNYNVLFRDESGKESQSQIAAFDDTWHWDIETEQVYQELVTGADSSVSRMIISLRDFIGTNQMMAYLVMMAVRLVELHRVLKPTGSLYLHCDPTASHYLKVVLDTIFEPPNFRNEIIWKRTSAHSDAKYKFPDVADIVLFYAKSSAARFQPQFGEYDPDYVERFYRYDDDDGRGPYRLDNMASPNPRPNMMYEWKGYSFPAKGWRYQKETMAELDAEGRIYYPMDGEGRPAYERRLALKRYLREQPGSIITNVWTDINPLHSSSSERLGYPTQKPLELLERIIEASSSEGDRVLDPFCGCGTAVHAAQKLNRHWLGIDITYLATNLIKSRLKSAFGLEAKKDYDVIGEPESVEGARHLARQNGYQFQIWATSLIGAQVQQGKRGADRGIDGAITFIDEARKKPKRIIIQVKGGHVGVAHIRDLVGTLKREKAVMGIYITLEAPTGPMQVEAASAGFYVSKFWGKQYPAVQIITIDQLLRGEQPLMPPVKPSYPQAAREPTVEAEQGQLGLDL